MINLTTRPCKRTFFYIFYNDLEIVRNSRSRLIVRRFLTAAVNLNFNPWTEVRLSMSVKVVSQTKYLYQRRMKRSPRAQHCTGARIWSAERWEMTRWLPTTPGRWDISRFCFIVMKYFHSDASPALLFHKKPAQGTQSPLLGAFLASRWFFMA